MSTDTRQRLRLEVSGAVQGVGFRPFVYRLALASGLSGWVLNDSHGVRIEVEGEREVLSDFARALRLESPEHAVIDRLETSWLGAQGLIGFEILDSAESGGKTAVVLPDLAVCSACLAEVLDESDRRFGYPFTNCTNCGPRFSIVEALPYDRPNTTMRGFVMCDACRAEYDDPADRRFHAQPNACPACGPSLELVDSNGKHLAGSDRALAAAAKLVLDGDILAVKGLGGFHLVVDAANQASVDRLRQRKGRYEKPLAVMAVDLAAAGRLVDLGDGAAELLARAEAPIVLLERLAEAEISDSVAPGNPRVGVMLAYTPLHQLLLRAIGKPVIATSGNLSDEPIATGNDEALERLGAIADAFLLHDRPIARHVDDSVMQWLGGRSQPIRRARGLAPLPIRMDRSLPQVLALGAHLKSTVALSVGDGVFVSQHIGDLETAEALVAFERVIGDFLDLYEANPVALARDLHPDYESSLWPTRAGVLQERFSELPLLSVQHHHAHLAACLADHRCDQPALGVVFDGTGYGSDGSIWGGEFLLGDANGFERIASLAPFRLPGGDAAVREPRRVALALLLETLGEAAFSRDDLDPVRALNRADRRTLSQMLASGFNSPLTTSAGRLFDGVSALLGLRQISAYEGQAAMLLEFAADPTCKDAYPLELRPCRPGEGGAPLVLDWRPMIAAILDDLGRGMALATIGARFHRALIEGMVKVARAADQEAVALCGGCFQNRLLSEWASERLRAGGHEVITHRRLPPNDGSISFGQVVVAAARLRQGE